MNIRYPLCMYIIIILQSVHSLFMLFDFYQSMFHLLLFYLHFSLSPSHARVCLNRETKTVYTGHDVPREYTLIHSRYSVPYGDSLVFRPRLQSFGCERCVYTLPVMCVYMWEKANPILWSSNLVMQNAVYWRSHLIWDDLAAKLRI